MTKGIVIWKFDLELVTEQVVEMPRQATVLSVGLQGDSIKMWAAVDPSQDLVNRKIYILGTGEGLPSDPWIRFRGTVMCDGFVWHIFCRN